MGSLSLTSLYECNRGSEFGCRRIFLTKTGWRSDICKFNFSAQNNAAWRGSLKMDGRIFYVICKVKESLDHDWTVAEMSAVAELSQVRFHKLFKKETGKSPKVYLKDLRLELARKLLETGFTQIKQSCTKRVLPMIATSLAISRGSTEFRQPNTGSNVGNSSRRSQKMAQMHRFRIHLTLLANRKLLKA